MNAQAPLKQSKRTFLSELDEEVDTFDTDLGNIQRTKLNNRKRFFTDEEGRERMKKLKMEKIKEEDEKIDDFYFATLKQLQTSRK